MNSYIDCYIIIGIYLNPLTCTSKSYNILCGVRLQHIFLRFSIPFVMLMNITYIRRYIQVGTSESFKFRVPKTVGMWYYLLGTKYVPGILYSDLSISRDPHHFWWYTKFEMTSICI